MDALLATSLGLAVRLLVDVGTYGNVRLGSSLVGIWEGIVLHHFVSKSPGLSDPYVAYAFRLFIDYLYTESLSRMTIILLWTALGVMASDVVVGTRRGRHDKSKSKRLQPAQPIEPPVNPRVRFHASKTPEPAPSSRPNRTIDSNPPLTPKQPPEQPKLPGGWSQTNSHSDQEQRSPAWQITSGPELLPSPVCLDDDSDFDTILRDGCHDYEALPSHVRDSFLTAVTQSDKSDSESTVSNGLHGANVLDTWDPSYAGPTSTVGELSVVPQVVDDERTASSDDDLATPTALLLLPAIPTDSHPPANNTSSAVDCDSHVPYKASDEHKGNEIPLPVIIRSTTSPPSPPYTPAKPQASVFHPDIVKLSHNISLPSSASSSDIESDVSTAKRVTLSHVAKYLRAQAKLQEKERARLELERRVAADEGRRTDVIRLDVEADEAAEKAEKFHQKAARKYWKAYNPSSAPFTIDVHRHRLNEAMRLTKRAIRDALEKDGNQLRVVVGNTPRGRLHSLRFAMKIELQKEKISFTEDRFKPGLLIIPLLSPNKA